MSSFDPRMLAASLLLVSLMACTPTANTDTQNDDQNDGIIADDMTGDNGSNDGSDDGSNDGGTDGGTDDGSNPQAAELSQNELDGIAASMQAIGALSDATSTTQGATRTDSAVSGQALPGVQPVFQPVTTFGECPEITLNLTNAASLAFDTTVDFGDSCKPSTATTVTCSGNATGSLNGLASSIAVQFNSVTCNNNTLEGSADLVYGVSEVSVELAGLWDLDWATGGTVLSTDGEGTCVYDRTTQVVTVVTFDGTISGNGVTWEFSAVGLEIAPLGNGSLVPSAGTLTLFGDGGRPVVIMFNEDTPTTGMVTINIDGVSVPAVLVF